MKPSSKQRLSDAEGTPAGCNPVAARQREELKYAHLSRRETPAIRENRRQLAEHIASIKPEPVPEPTGERLETVYRRRPKRSHS
jgi:hypothetical protein